MNETYERWEFKIPILGTGKNKKEAFENAIEHTDLGYTDIDDCEGVLDEVVDENDEEI